MGIIYLQPDECDPESVRNRAVDLIVKQIDELKRAGGYGIVEMRKTEKGLGLILKTRKATKHFGEAIEEVGLIASRRKVFDKKTENEMKSTFLLLVRGGQRPF